MTVQYRHLERSEAFIAVESFPPTTRPRVRLLSIVGLTIPGVTTGRLTGTNAGIDAVRRSRFFQ
jgi:hypothetical protein